MTEEMIQKLNDYYQINGISAENFNCQYYLACSQKFPGTFTTAKESFISTGYVSHELPRLVFLSLDSGSAEVNPKFKTIESVRLREEEELEVQNLHKNKHWYRTHELAFKILRNFQPKLKLEEAKHYFAHVNSAKCCENKPGRAQASRTLFDNCRQYIPGELRILDPDILITQGNWAKRATADVFCKMAMPDYVPVTLSEIKIIAINNHPVLLIETYHPRYPGFHTKNRSNYPLYEEVVRKFIQSRSSF